MSAAPQPSKVVHWEESRYEGEFAALAALAAVRSGKKTGSLTLHFHKGGIGNADWKEKDAHSSAVST